MLAIMNAIPAIKKTHSNGEDVPAISKIPFKKLPAVIVAIPEL